MVPLARPAGMWSVRLRGWWLPPDWLALCSRRAGHRFPVDLNGGLVRGDGLLIPAGLPQGDTEVVQRSALAVPSPVSR